MERSSCGVRDEAKMERRTAGVTGMRLLSPLPLILVFEVLVWAVIVRVEVVDAEDM
jgi:hypothetical protein